MCWIINRISAGGGVQFDPPPLCFFTPSKEICTFLVFLNYTSGSFKFCKHFAYLKWNGKWLFKKVNFITFWTILFCKIFTKNWILQKELSNDVLFVMIGHQKWDLEGVVKLTSLPPAYLAFKYPAGIGLNCLPIKFYPKKSFFLSIPAEHSTFSPKGTLKSLSVWCVIFNIDNAHQKTFFMKIRSSVTRKSQMWWHGRLVVVHGCWEEKKSNMWPGRGNSGGTLPPETSSIICLLFNFYDNFEFKISRG